MTQTSASGLVKEALEAHLVNLSLDVDAERLMAKAPGGERRELAEIAVYMVPWLYALEKGDHYKMGRISIELGRSMTKKMTDALVEPLKRCIAAAWVAEERRLEQERENGKVAAKCRIEASSAFASVISSGSTSLGSARKRSATST